MAWQIRKQDIPLIAIGAKMIGCGGGGKTKTIENLLLSLMKDEDTVTVKSISDLKDEWIVGVGMMGSTVLFNEDIPSGLEGTQLLKRYEEITQKKVGAVISVEIAGINALSPLLTALLNHLPIVDGDAMGRAFPELTMTTFHLHQIPVTPIILQAHERYMVIKDSQSIKNTVDKVKEFITANGGYVHFSCFGAHASQIRTSMIPGTYNMSYRLGSVVAKEIPIREKMEEITAVFENSLYGKPLHIISGMVSSVNRWFDGGSLIGQFTVEGHASFSAKSIEIEFRNEFISIKEQQYICTTPDLILVLDEEKLSAYSVSEIQVGIFVTILAVPAPNILRTKDMLELVGPQNFNLAVPYKPLQGEHHHETWN